MPTITSICNQALVKLGAETVINIDQGTTEAIICKAFYEDTLQAVLDEYPWSFATQRYQLPQSAETPPAPFAAQYLIPSNVLRIVEASANPNFERENTTDWRVENGFILSNMGSMYIRAIVKTTDPSKYSPGFVRAFVARLAAEMCTAVTSSREMAAQLSQEYVQVVQRAINADSQQARTRKYRSNQLITVRQAGNTSAGPYV